MTPTAGASCSTLTGPTLDSADDDIANIDDDVVYEWTCTVAAGATPGSLTFSDAATGTVRSRSRRPRPTACSSRRRSPSPRRCPTAHPNPIVDQGMLAASGETVELAARPDVHRRAGPDDREVELAGLGHDPPARRSDHVHDGSSRTPESGTPRTSWSATRCRRTPSTGAARAGPPAATRPARSRGRSARSRRATPPRSRSPSARARRSPVSDTDYTISNTATVDSDRDEPGRRATPSRTSSRCSPRSSSRSRPPRPRPGDTLTYTLSVSNPGAAFTGDVSDVVPTGTSFADNCSPACSFAAGTVTWSGATIPPAPRRSRST